MDDLDSFDSYCIVCDKLIEPLAAAADPSTIDPIASTAASVSASGKPIKKKSAQGTIRVKNPDGSTTTRTANGVKTTRPAIKRNGTSAARLAALAAANTKLAPLTRSSSTDGDAAAVLSPLTSPSSETPPPAVTPPAETPFSSSIYCSAECAHADAGRSSVAYDDIARTFSLDFGNHNVSFDQIVTANLRVPSQGPPSPLFGSDTDSSTSATRVETAAPTNAAVLAAAAAFPAASAPKTMEYFRMSRDSPDDAWREVDRQRRSSMAASRALYAQQTTAAAYPPRHAASSTHLARQRSGQSATYSVSGASSDSLNSLDDHDVVHRSASNGGFMRAMTPMYRDTRDTLGAGHRSMSSSSDGSATGAGVVTPGVPTGASRPLTRTNLSQTSLAGLSPSPGQNAFPPEFGSAPSHTAYLFQSYASAFQGRDGSSNLSTSYKSATSTPIFPGSLTPADSRRGSMNAGAAILRPLSGTIRARPRTDSAPTWDSFGKQEILERSRSARPDATVDEDAIVTSPDSRGRHASLANDVTPKQSLEVANGRWQIRYTAATPEGVPTRRQRSASRSTVGSVDISSAVPIPARAASALSTSQHSARTPRAGSGMTSPPLPNIASLRLNAGIAAAPQLSQEYATSPPSRRTSAAASSSSSQPMSTSVSMSGGRSAPKPGFDWDRRGTKTYELPRGVVANPNKGLFYFNA